MYFYEIHGLCLASEFPLQGVLETGKREPDAVVRLHRGIFVVPSEVVSAGQNYCVTAVGTFIFDDRLTVCVRNGREMFVKPAAGLAPEELAADVRALFGALLFQRGRFVLHASTVAINRNAVAFVGHSGQGKSSLALALYKRGCEFLSDDVTSLDLAGAVPLIFPSCPIISVWPDTYAAFSRLPETERNASASKCSLVLSARFAREPRPLRHLYVLAQGKNTMIEPLAPLEALKELLTHSRRADLPESDLVRTHLNECARLISTVRVLRLTVHRADGPLAELARLVERDVVSAV